MVKLFTDRLIIRDYVIEDLEDLHKLLPDKKVLKYIPEEKSENIEKTKKYYGYLLDRAIKICYI
jgi:RimJ/RimL family protein N-acetyltransferase